LDRFTLRPKSAVVKASHHNRVGGIVGQAMSLCTGMLPGFRQGRYICWDKIGADKEQHALLPGEHTRRHTPSFAPGKPIPTGAHAPVDVEEVQGVGVVVGFSKPDDGDAAVREHRLVVRRHDAQFELKEVAVKHQTVVPV
jgi:hypothetical protein